MVWLRVLPLRVAATALRKKAPAQIVVAVPIASSSTCSELEAEDDRVVCAVTPEPFWAVGQWYRNFFHRRTRRCASCCAAPPSFIPQKQPRSSVVATDQLQLRAIRENSHPINSSETDYDLLIQLVGDRRLVLIGEATHGTHEFYHTRAELTRRR